jgi:hypothetical protein
MAELPTSKAGAVKGADTPKATTAKGDIEAGPAIQQIIPPRPPKETLRDDSALQTMQNGKHELASTNTSHAGTTDSTMPESTLPCMASPVNAWGSMLRRAYVSVASSSLPLQLLSALLLAPLLSVTINVMSAVLGFWLLVAVGKGGERDHSWAFMNVVDIRKCCDLRALLVVLIEAPASIAFVTWAYLAPSKNPVGVFVYSSLFIISMSFSMLHVVFEMWHLKNQLLETGSVGSLVRYKLDLGARPASASSGADADASDSKDPAVASKGNVVASKGATVIKEASKDVATDVVKM